MNRKTAQFITPIHKENVTRNSYDIYPSFSTEETIYCGFESLVNEIDMENVVILDGYIGVDWQEIVLQITKILKQKKKSFSFVNMSDCFLSQDKISEMVKPFLGGEDPIFGKKTNLILQDFFDQKKIRTISFDENSEIHIVYGLGSSLSKFKGKVIYFDVPKNELQYRMRSGAIRNLGFQEPKDPKEMYKHFYFIDWIVLNTTKKQLLPSIDIFVDQQRPKQPVWMYGEGLRKTIHKMSHSFFRVRPWFEPGVWGGHWMKDRFDQLNKEVPNYAWSFEMIVPENGLLLENGTKLLECSFDMLMFQEQENILGKAAKRFKDEFPIRFDFLDTFKGGNLSVQCHPGPDYIKKEFGESFTQDETYYILDAEENANVYLGFQDGVDPNDFRQALEHCYQTKEVLDVEKYIQKLPSKKHDLFLIPHGTVHCSGIDNMVLEISATPYIYTFKMYDWQRLDLDGNPRPLNIKRAFENLNFDRQGKKVLNTLVSKPKVEALGKNWKKVHLPTHKDHFYAIYRYEFDEEVEIQTLNQCHVLMLVGGTSVELNVSGVSKTFQYAETFAVPAAASIYKLMNLGSCTAKVIISFVKEEAC